MIKSVYKCGCTFSGTARGKGVMTGTQGNLFCSEHRERFSHYIKYCIACGAEMILGSRQHQRLWCDKCRHGEKLKLKTQAQRAKRKKYGSPDTHAMVDVVSEYALLYEKRMSLINNIGSKYRPPEVFDTPVLDRVACSGV